ncbi:hypothetical protein [Streptomyces sp. NPDC058371]|jgi:hypothetical protein|uniref:hypothetical protein n=1 Tax=Streptomyces sp. NPDC058371 TaxID=3346463 RepID=UPI003665A832
MRSLRKATTSVATVALALLAAACGSGSGSPSGSKQNTNTSTESAPSTAPPKSTAPASPSETDGTSFADGEVCAKLTASDVEKIVGKPVKADDLMLDVNSPEAVSKPDPTICTYHLPTESGRQRFVSVGRIGPPESTSEWKNVESRNRGKLTDEFGAGTQGVGGDSGIYLIRKGDAVITFQGIEAGLDDAVLKKLARKAVEVL